MDAPRESAVRTRKKTASTAEEAGSRSAARIGLLLVLLAAGLLLGPSVLGPDYGMRRISDIQVDRSGGKRRMLVGFMDPDDSKRDYTLGGGIGVYSGD